MYKLFNLLSMIIIVTSLLSSEAVRKFKIINNTSSYIFISAFPIKNIMNGNLISQYADMISIRLYDQNGERKYFHGIPLYTNDIKNNTHAIVYLEDTHYTNEDGKPISHIQSQAKWFRVCDVREAPALETGDKIEELQNTKFNASDKIEIEDNMVYEVIVDSDKYVIKKITVLDPSQ